MLNNILKSIFIALDNMRANPMHTILSTLGIIIGIAALVAILSVGDGLEKLGREQIGSNTSLQYMSVTSQLSEFKNGIRIPLENRHALNYADYEDVKQDSDKILAADLFVRGSAMVQLSGDSTTHPARIVGRTEGFADFESFSFEGRNFSRDEILNTEKVAIINANLDSLIDSTRSVLNHEIQFNGDSYEIIGIADADLIRGEPQVFIPVTVFRHSDNTDVFPQMLIKGRQIEDILLLKDEVDAFLKQKYPQARFSIGTNEERVEQFEDGILLFKLVMGLITGISVLVGGIGVMNVLLISIKDRTKEIGIRKATGAKRTDILLQFLSESVTITFAGCLMGLGVGMIAVFAFAPLVDLMTNFDFPVTFTWSTILFVLLIGFLVGIIFGTYPAWRASQLTPVEAIRRE
jgi:putative ABC transport system permease protein